MRGFDSHLFRHARGSRTVETIHTETSFYCKWCITAAECKLLYCLAPDYKDERMRPMQRRRAEKFRDIPWYGSGIAERGEKATCNVSDRGRRVDRRIIVEWYRRS